MAVSVGNTSSSSGTTSSLAWSHTSNSDYLVVCISIYDDSAAISSVQWGSTSLSLVSGTNVINSGMGQVAIYAGAVAATGTQNITVALDSSVDVAAAGVSFIGSDQTCSGVDTSNVDNVSASLCNVTGSGNGDYIVDASMCDKNPSIGPQQTELYDVGFGGASSANASYQDAEDGDGMSWGSVVNGDFAHAACVIDEAASSPQSRTVTAVSADGDSKVVTRLAGGVSRSVSEASASGDSPAVTTLSEATRAVSAASANGEAPSVTAAPGVASRAVVEADAAGDAPAASPAPGNVNRSVTEATATADSPAASAEHVTDDQTREVSAASADGDAKTASAQPGNVNRSVTEADAAGDAPTAAAAPGVASRVVAGASADGDAPAATPTPGLASRTVVEGSALGDAPTVSAFTAGGTQSAPVSAADAGAEATTIAVVPGVASRAVVAGSALGDAPTASPGFVLLVSAASAWAVSTQVFPENLKYQHFNVRGQRRGYTGLPPSTGPYVRAVGEASGTCDAPAVTAFTA